MGHTIPTLFVLLTAAGPLSAADCPFDKYYISLPSNTCVSDGEHTSQPGPILLYDTKEACCNGLTRKERRQCLKAEVPSEVYPDFEKGRCSPSTQRPPVVYPACVIDGDGAVTSVSARFLKESLPVSDNEMCCRNVYGGIDQAAVDRCAARRGTWSYVAGMGCVRDDPLADDPVVYAAAQTAGSLSACTKTYFPQSTAFMCDDFTCPSGWTSRTYNIHCGPSASACTNKLCCRPTCGTFTCGTHSTRDKNNKDTIICPDATGCSAYDCCDGGYGSTLSPECNTVTYPPNYPGATFTHVWRKWWTINCKDGQIPHVTIDSFDGLGGVPLQLFNFFEDGTNTWELRLENAHTDVTVPSAAHPSRGAHSYFLLLRVDKAELYTSTAGFSMRYKCIDP